MTDVMEGAKPSELVPARIAPATSKVPDGPIETACKWGSMLLLAGLLVLVGSEVVLRNTLGLSWEGTDEYGGYALVAITFLSIPICLARGGLHEMQIVRARLSPKGLAALNIALHLISLLFVVVLAWQFGRLEITTWRVGDVSVTGVMTPLWIPRSVMFLGTAAVALTLVRLIIAECRRFREASESGRTTRGA